MQNLNQKKSAEHCFRQYINLLLAGAKGSYTLDDAARFVRRTTAGRKKQADKEKQDAIASTLHDSGLRLFVGERTGLPQLALQELLATG